MSRAAARRPTLYFSFRSPYSWLALRKLRAAVADLDEVFDCRPYWDPDPQTSQALQERGGEFHYQQMSRAKHLYMLMDTKRLATAADLPMAWPIDVDPWWELPHLAWLYARGAGRAWPFYDAVTDARWGRGENICRSSVLAAAARVAGVDPQAALAAAGDATIRQQAVDCLYEAYRDDIFGIPYIKWGRQRFWGIDRVDAFLAAWQPTSRPLTAGHARPGQPIERSTAMNEPTLDLAVAAEQTAPRDVPADADAGDPQEPGTDPLEGVPLALLAGSGGYDTDTAGGCG